MTPSFHITARVGLQCIGSSTVYGPPKDPLLPTGIGDKNWNINSQFQLEWGGLIPIHRVLPMLSLPLSVFSGKQTHFVAHLSLSNLFPLLIPLRTCNKHTSATLPPPPPPSLDEFLSEASGGAPSTLGSIPEWGGKCDRCGGQTLVCLDVYYG